MQVGLGLSQQYKNLAFLFKLWYVGGLVAVKILRDNNLSLIFLFILSYINNVF